MAFNTLYFLLFLFIASLCFYASKKLVIQQWVLLVSSLVFVFLFNPFSALALVGISVINYLLLRKLSALTDPHKKKLYLFGVAFNVALLVAYKFLQEVLTGSGMHVLKGFDNSKWIILGVGFYTLQVIGYFFEVYKRRAKFELSFIQFFLTLAFFSKLPAGPILNLNQAKSIIHNGVVLFQESNISYGIQRILLGLFKKVALADRLAFYVDSVFDEHVAIYGLNIYLAPFLFTIQLYLDFSGYIDIAIGTGRIFGIILPENFSLPLRATSIVEFWRRWHITLVQWLTNYIFYPISFRYRKWKQKGIAVAVICTFLVSALWHGFALTFFVWAACHFVYIIIENIFSKGNRGAKEPSLVVRILQICLVWHLVAFSNIFFRSGTLKSALVMFKDFRGLHFLYADGSSFAAWLVNGGQDIENEFNYRMAIVLSFIFLLFERKLNQYGQSEKYNTVYVALMLVAIITLGMFNGGERFIYLQF